MPDIVLERLKALHPKVIDLSLDRVLRLLAALGDPHLSLPPAIHVAGTNGKGSTIAFLRAILEAAGLRVHVYTSPHLVRFAERIRLAGNLIADEDLVRLLEECESANHGRPITFFEITTGAAFLAFARTPADVLLLETGLGGRLDATNVLPKPALTALTPISMDHMSYLGDTLAAIAAEKVGIMKPGVGCVVADQERAANKVIAARSMELGVPIWQEGEGWFVRTQGDGILFQSKDNSWALPHPALAGAHQMRNAGLALACVEHLEGFAVPPAALALGMKTVEWPARLQRLTKGPLAAALPEGWELWLDGGHNPAAGKMLAQVARGWRDKPLHMIFGMLATKDARGFLKPLGPRLQSLKCVTIEGEPNALSAETAKAAALADGILQAEAEADPARALAAILAENRTPGRILIAGSLYLAGRVLAENG